MIHGLEVEDKRQWDVIPGWAKVEPDEEAFQ